MENRYTGISDAKPIRVESVIFLFFLDISNGLMLSF